MKITKNALRWLPAAVLLEILSPLTVLLVMAGVLVLPLPSDSFAATITAMSAGMLQIAVWLGTSVLLWGIKALSKRFETAWYFHILYLLVRSSNLVLAGIAAGIPEPAPVWNVLTELLSLLLLLILVLSQHQILAGFRAVLERSGENTISRKCRKFGLLWLTAGILLVLSDTAGTVFSLGFPENTDLSAEYVPFIGAYLLCMVLTAGVSIPVMLTVRKSCMTVYRMLADAQEG